MCWFRWRRYECVLIQTAVFMLCDLWKLVSWVSLEPWNSWDRCPLSNKHKSWNISCIVQLFPFPGQRCDCDLGFLFLSCGFVLGVGNIVIKYLKFSYCLWHGWFYIPPGFHSPLTNCRSSPKENLSMYWCVQGKRRVQNFLFYHLADLNGHFMWSREVYAEIECE
jgi:hypothetical protein